MNREIQQYLPDGTPAGTKTAALIVRRQINFGRNSRRSGRLYTRKSDRAARMAGYQNAIVQLLAEAERIRRRGE